VSSIHAESNDNLSKDEHPTIQVELDGVVGARQSGNARSCHLLGSPRSYEAPAPPIIVPPPNQVATIVALPIQTGNRRPATMKFAVLPDVREA